MLKTTSCTCWCLLQLVTQLPDNFRWPHHSISVKDIRRPKSAAVILVNCMLELAGLCELDVEEADVLVELASDASLDDPVDVDVA